MYAYADRGPENSSRKRSENDVDFAPTQNGVRPQVLPFGKSKPWKPKGSLGLLPLSGFDNHLLRACTLLPKLCHTQGCTARKSAGIPGVRESRVS